MRNTIAIAVASLALAGLSRADETSAINERAPAGARLQSKSRQPTNIPAQNLRVALQTLSRERDLQFIFRQDVIGSVVTHDVQGDLTVDEALTKLLSGTQLTYKYLDDKTVTIVPIATAPPATEQTSGKPPDAKPIAGQTEKTSFLRLDAAHSASPPESSSSSTASPNDSVLKEVVVTAQKKVERLQDVPVPVTALNADALVNSNQLRLQDFYASVPALNYTQDFRGGSTLSIRGISSGVFSNPTIGIVVDDIPYGPSTSLGGGFTAPEFDPSDLARIEVLRGPQGTLYGANSIGGLFKYVTIDPSMDRLDGTARVGLSSVRNGDGLGYNVRGAVNVPLSDTWAFRVSGFTRHDPGYIDDPSLDLEGVNDADARGGRLTALWQPSEALSLKLGAMLQRTGRDGSAQINVASGLGDLEQNVPRGTGTYDSKSQFYTATLKARLGEGIDLTSLSGYGKNSWSDNPDYSHAPWGGLAQSVFGVPAASLPESNETKKYTQEVRLSMPLGSRLEWLFGGFYTHEKTEWLQKIVAVDPATGQVAGTGLDYDFGPTSYEESAVFTDLTVQVTDRFDVQLGARQSWNTQKHDERGVYPFFGGFVFDPDEMRTRANAFTYLLTPRLRLSPDVMMYARLASGYRAGGPNYLTSATNFPLAFEPDKTRNYELGIKGGALDRAFSYDVSVYHIDWSNLQVNVADAPSGLTGYINAGEARSRGIELSLEAHPTERLTLAGWVARNDAELTEDFPATAGNGLSGDRLPYTSKWSGRLSVEQSFSLANTAVGFAGISVVYVGDRTTSFSTVTQPQESNLPSYVQVDLHAGAMWQLWAVNAFVNNIGDRRGLLSGDPLVPTRIYYIQPRTFGVSLSRNF